MLKIIVFRRYHGTCCSQRVLPYPMDSIPLHTALGSRELPFLGLLPPPSYSPRILIGTVVVKTITTCMIIHGASIGVSSVFFPFFILLRAFAAAILPLCVAFYRLVTRDRLRLFVCALSCCFLRLPTPHPPSFPLARRFPPLHYSTTGGFMTS